VLAAAAAILLGASPRAHAQAGQEVEYYALDAVGSVRVVFDANGVVTGRMDYAPFGEELYSGLFMPSERFAQLTRDGEAGLDYAEARMYQSRTGRLNAPDPVYTGLFQPQRWNRYAYSLNSPLTVVDPSGLDPCTNPEWNAETEAWTFDCNEPPSREADDAHASAMDFFWRMEWCWRFGPCGRPDDHGSGGPSSGSVVVIPTPVPPAPPQIPQAPPPPAGQTAPEAGAKFSKVRSIGSLLGGAAINGLADKLECGHARAALHGISAVLEFTGAVEAAGIAISSAVATVTTSPTVVGAVIGTASTVTFGGLTVAGAVGTSRQLSEVHRNLTGCSGR
jgi:RHS repeat-associated protein